MQRKSSNKETEVVSSIEGHLEEFMKLKKEIPENEFARDILEFL